MSLWAFSGRGNDPFGLARSANREDRLRAIELLRRCEGSQATDVLLELCSDGDLRVAVTAAWALGELHTPARRDALVSLLKDVGRHGRIRAEAAAAVGGFASLDPGILTAVLRGDRDPLVRAGAARGLYRLRKVSTLPALVDALEDADPRVRKWAIEAVHHLTVRRFAYDPARAPSAQRAVLREIRDFFRRAGAI